MCDDRLSMRVQLHACTAAHEHAHEPLRHSNHCAERTDLSEGDEAISQTTKGVSVRLRTKFTRTNTAADEWTDLHLEFSTRTVNQNRN